MLSALNAKQNEDHILWNGFIDLKELMVSFWQS